MVATDAPGELRPAAEQQVLSFRVAGTEFGCPVRDLREVVELVEIARVDGQARGTEGVINYRGAVIPVVDGRRALGFDVAASADAHIVVAEVRGRLVGLVVDHVLDVLVVPASLVEPPGPLTPLRELLSGIAKLGERLVFLLDLAELVSEERLARVPLPALTLAAPARGPGAVLRRRTAELAKPVEATAGRVAQSTVMVCFALGEGAYAVKADFAKEIVEVPTITRIPCTPSFVLGAVNVRGAIIVVVSVAELLGFHIRAEAATDARIIVLDAGGTLLGLHVQRVLGIHEIDGRDVAAPFAQLDAQSSACIEGEFDLQGRVVCLIDAAAIARTLEQTPGEGYGPTAGTARPSGRLAADEPSAGHRS